MPKKYRLEKITCRYRIFSIALSGFILSACGLGHQQTNPGIAGLLTDIDYICELVPANYIYFEDKSIDWREACAIAKKEANKTTDVTSRLGVLESLIWELYDPHLNLGVSTQASPQLVPTNSDIAISVKEGVVRIISLRPKSPASENLKAGDIVQEIDGLPVLQAAGRRMKTGDRSNLDRLSWAITGELAGRQNRNRSIKISRAGKDYQFDLEPHKPLSRPVMSAVGRLGDETCFIRPHNSLGQNVLVKEISDFMASTDCKNGIIFDLRDTASGGNTGVAEPILGLFIKEQLPYQILSYKDGRKVEYFPKPSGADYSDIPMVILVGPWTGSMGEGMAIGFDGTGRAPVLGGEMAKLGGALNVFTLPHSKYTLQLPTIDTLHIDGKRRTDFRSPVLNTRNIGLHVSEYKLRNALLKFVDMDH